VSTFDETIRSTNLYSIFSAKSITKLYSFPTTISTTESATNKLAKLSTVVHSNFAAIKSTINSAFSETYSTTVFPTLQVTDAAAHRSTFSLSYITAIFTAK
jgi:hypothetical protein